MSSAEGEEFDTADDESFDDSVRDLNPIFFGSGDRGTLTAYVPGETDRQFRELRQEVQDDLNVDEVTNGEFLQMLLDCWALHRDIEDRGVEGGSR